MNPDLKRRLPIALVGAGFLALGPVVSWLGRWKSSGHIASRPPVSILVGHAAQWLALSFTCMGIAILGVLLPRRGLVAVWMAVWLIIAIAVRFIEPVTCAPYDQFSKLCW